MSGLDMPKCVVDHDHEHDEGHCVYEDWWRLLDLLVVRPLTPYEDDPGLRDVWLEGYAAGQRDALPASSSALARTIEDELTDHEMQSGGRCACDEWTGRPDRDDLLQLARRSGRRRTPCHITGPATEEEAAEVESMGYDIRFPERDRDGKDSYRLWQGEAESFA